MAAQQILFSRGCCWRQVVAQAGGRLTPALRLESWQPPRWAWRVSVAGEAQVTWHKLCLWPSGLILVAAWSDGGFGADVRAPALCDDSAAAEPMPEIVETLLKLRGVLALLKNTSDLDYDAFIDAGRATYRSAVGKDGRLNQAGLEQMLQKASAEREQKTVAGLHMPWAQTAHTACACELAPILLHLLDVDGDGNISEKEFLMGQALILAAAKAHTPEVLTELCWRALDDDGNGMLSRDEVEAAVRLMVRVNAVRPQDRREKYAKIVRPRGPPRNLFRDRSIDDLVIYYMDMYDTNKDGSISKAEFCQHSALHENFYLLLTSPEFEPILQAQALMASK